MHITVVPLSSGGSGVDAGAVHYAGDTPTTGQQQAARVTIGAAQRLAPTVVRTSAHAVNLGDLDNNDTTSGPFTATAPAASAPGGAVFGVKKLDSSSNILTLAAAGSDVFVTKSASGTLTTATSVTFAVQESRTFVCDGVSKWYVLDGHIPQSVLNTLYASNYNFRTVTSAATAATGDYVLADTTSATFAVAAPTPTAGTRWGIKWTAGTVPPTLTGTFNTAYAFSNLLQSAEFISDGTKWYRATVEAPPDLSAYATASDLSSHISQTYHNGGVTYVKFGVAWPSSRPSGAGMVIILGTTSGAGNTAPTWMTSADIFMTPDVTGSTVTYLAAQDFEGWTAGTLIPQGSANSGTPLDVVSKVTPGGTATAVATTAGGGQIAGQFVVGSTAGTTWGGFRAASAGSRTSATVGCRWINPLVATPFGSNNMQLLRLRRDTTGSGSYVTAPAIRLNGGTQKFELLGADGLVAWTSGTVFNGTSSPPAYYDLELRIDCTNTHMQMFITPAGSATETVGDMTTTKSTGIQVDEYACGVLSSFASNTATFDWLRVADVATRVNQ